MRFGAAFARGRRAAQGVTLAAALLLLGAFSSPALASGGGAGGGSIAGMNVAATPPMGWDSWDAFGCGVNEKDIEQAANALVAYGLRDAGYRYVIIDDCWYNPTRSADGTLRPNTSKFPTGMRWLAWYLHSRGLRLGIYESASQSTCAQDNSFYPGSTGSLGHEQEDARTFASWGVDYLKYDWCSPSGTLQEQVAAFTQMRNALRATRRPIVYSINPNSFHAPTGATYNWSSIANLVRTTPDVAPFWDTGQLSSWFAGVENAIMSNQPLWRRAGPGHWNDPDTLMVGLNALRFTATINAQGLNALLTPPLGSSSDALSREGMRTNFAMWAMMAAPLILADDVRYVSPAMQRILLNPALIAIDQDPLGRQGHRVGRGVWAKPLIGQAVAAALFNDSGAPTRITTTARQLGLPAAPRYTVLDVWTGRQWLTPGPVWQRVPARGVAVLRITPVFKPVTAVFKPVTAKGQQKPPRPR